MECQKAAKPEFSIYYLIYLQLKNMGFWGFRNAERNAVREVFGLPNALKRGRNADGMQSE